MLRLDVDADDFPADDTRDYAVPAGNSFTSLTDGLPEIFAVGLRNPFRASFDPVTGDLLIGDVGQNAIEEISRLPIDDSSLNFGWNLIEGTQDFNGTAQPDFTPPVAEYSHGSGPREGNSVTGGHIYAGPVEALQNVYIFGDFVSANIWGLPAEDLINGQTVASADFDILTLDFTPNQETIDNVASFGTDALQNLYIVDFDGDIFKLDAADD